MGACYEMTEDIASERDGLVTLVSDGQSRKVTGDARLARPVFSVTKMFVAAAALRLAEDGALDLDGPARGWLPEVPGLAGAGGAATLREVLRHAAGLPDYARSPAYLAAVAARPGRPWGPEQILACAFSGGDGPAGQAGPAGGRPARGEFSYSNAGYWIAGAVLERAAGAPLGQVLGALIFGPCGMTSTRYPAGHDGQTADGYDTRWAGPAGAAWSTAADLDLFLRALATGSLLAGPSLAMMMSPVPVPPQPPWRQPGYGLGLMVDSGRDVAGHGVVVGHGGEGPGYQAAAFIAPGEGRSAIVLARSSAEVSAPELAVAMIEQET